MSEVVRDPQAGQMIARLNSLIEEFLAIAEQVKSYQNIDSVSTRTNVGPPKNSPALRTKEEISMIEARLVLHARMILDHRNKRRTHLPGELFGEPGWEMLVDLFIQNHLGRSISVSSLCQAANSPNTTALRHLGLLEKYKLVERYPASHDKRVIYVKLTTEGYVRLGTHLAEVSLFQTTEHFRDKGFLLSKI